MTSNGPGHSIFYETTCQVSNDSDQLAQMRRLISHCFALISQTSKLSLDERQRFCLECVYAQADLSLRWAHMQSSRKRRVSVEIPEILLYAI